MRRPSLARGKIARSGYQFLPMLPVGWLLLFFVVPLAFVVVYSVAYATFGGVTLGFTLTNFRQALSGFYLHIFLHTLTFALIGSAFCAAVALPLAYVMARKAGRFGGVLLVALLVPFWTSFLIRSLSWETLLAPSGPVQAALNFLQLHHGQLNVLDTNTAVLIGIVYGYLPLMAIPLYVAFERVPASLIDASKDMGAGRLRTFLHLTLPLARPGIAAAALLTFVPMTGEYVIPALLGGDKGVLMGGLIYSQFLGSQDYPLGSALAVLLLAVLGVAVVALIRASRGFDEVAA
jgi:ABC-type spermidine/putrescine transport system permease subunit I